MSHTPASFEQICEWLVTGVLEATSALYNLEAQPEDYAADLKGPTVAAVGGFTGEMNGEVRLIVSREFAYVLAGRMLSLAETDLELESETLVNDVVIELNNMISGSVKSRLCDTGLPCTLRIPVLAAPAASAPDAGERRRVAFRCGADRFLVELALGLPAAASR